MIFKIKKHNIDLYNTLLKLSRNIFFYKKIKLIDKFETRIYLMLFHFSLMMIVFKKKNNKFDQLEYDTLFQNIENNLRELGLGDISVNKKMKDLNKILYDIVLKIDKNLKDEFTINDRLILKYFSEIKSSKTDEYQLFKRYFYDFYNYCFELSLKNMIREAINFKN
jgi:cytochrome b pre-mRNA-processing protein 3